MPIANVAVSALAPNHRKKRSRGVPCRSRASIASSPCGSTATTLAPYGAGGAGDVTAARDRDAGVANLLQRALLVAGLHVHRRGGVLDHDDVEPSRFRVERGRLHAVVG